MNTKTVYQCLADGTYFAETSAFESPLEPGVWHIPAGCVEVPPPEVPAGSRARWVGAAWAIEEEAQPAPEPEPAPPTIADVVAERDRRLYVLASAYTSSERETWPTQVAEARAILADPEAAAPLLTELAEVRGITMTQMAERVIVLADALAVAVGKTLAACTGISALDPIPEDYTDDSRWGS